MFCRNPGVFLFLPLCVDLVQVFAGRLAGVGRVLKCFNLHFSAGNLLPVMFMLAGERFAAGKVVFQILNMLFCGFGRFFLSCIIKVFEKRMFRGQVRAVTIKIIRIKIRFVVNLKQISGQVVIITRGNADGFFAGRVVVQAIKAPDQFAAVNLNSVVVNPNVILLGLSFGLHGLILCLLAAVVAVQGGPDFFFGLVAVPDFFRAMPAEPKTLQNFPDRVAGLFREGNFNGIKLRVFCDRVVTHFRFPFLSAVVVRVCTLVSIR